MCFCIKFEYNNTKLQEPKDWKNSGKIFNAFVDGIIDEDAQIMLEQLKKFLKENNKKQFLRTSLFGWDYERRDLIFVAGSQKEFNDNVVMTDFKLKYDGKYITVSVAKLKEVLLRQRSENEKKQSK